MRLPSNRNLLIVAAVLVAAVLVIRARGTAPSALPWNRGQAGSIFNGMQAGGGQ